MSFYLGSEPVPQAILRKESTTLTAGQTVISTGGYSDGDLIQVSLNGVIIEGSGVDYTASNGSDVTLTVAGSAGDVLQFQTFDAFELVGSKFSAPTITNNVTLKNDTEEDTDGGRLSKLVYKGEQSGGQESTLAEIQASHDGSSNDQKGDLIFKTNDGSDNAAPTEALKIDSNQRLSMTRGDTLTELSMDANRSGASQSIGRFNYFWNGTQVAKIEGMTGSDTTNKDDGELRFQTRESGSALADRWRITSEGHFKAMSNGLGIDFSATEGSGASSSILDDYEEGSFVPTYTCASGTITTTSNAGKYVKVGDLVHCHFRIRSTGVSGLSGAIGIAGFPFTAVSDGRSSGSKWFARDWLIDMPNFSFGVVAGTTAAALYKHAMNASASSVSHFNFGTGSDDNVLEASITYQVA